MIYRIYKSPRRPDALPVETYSYEPFGIVLEQLAKKYGPIEIVQEDEILQ